MLSLDGLHIALVPSWWPSPQQPIAGIFFRTYAQAYAAAGARVGVIYPDLVGPRDWLRPPRPPIVPVLSVQEDEQVPVVRVRGLHSAVRIPAIQMRRFLAWLRHGLKEYCRRFGNPDVLHAMCAIPAGWSCLHLGADWARRTLVTEHTGPFEDVLRPQSGGSYALKALTEAPAVVAVSDHLRGQMRACGIARPIEVVHNPVDAAFLDPSPPPAATQDHSGRATLSAVFVGRLVPEKGLHELAAAAIRLAEAPGAPTAIDWHIVGDGPLAQPLRARLAEAGLRDRLHMHGFLSRHDVARRIRDADLLVLPSHGETCSLVACEALSMGRPVIGTRETALEELIGPEDGLLCAPGGVDSLLDAIATFCAAPQRWSWQAIAARAARRFHPRRVAEQYAPLFRQLAGRGVGGD